MTGRLRSVMSRWLSHMLDLDNVVGVGVGLKETGGRVTGRQSISVLVRRKLPAGELVRSQMIPATLGGDALTDVVEVGDMSLLNESPEELPSRTARSRPAPGGVSVGHIHVTAGTLGMVVKDRDTGRRLILSNNHVLANLSNGRDQRARIGDPILQPSAHDGGTITQDLIARLERFVPLHRTDALPACPIARTAERVGNIMVASLSTRYELKVLRKGPMNQVDAAVARPVAAEDVSPEIMEIGRPKGIADPRLGRIVRKSGRSSGITRGEIRVVEATLRVLLPDGATASFSDQIVTTAMASPGDSGSVAVDDDNMAVGLLCAGSRVATMYCRFDLACSKLGVDLVR